MKEIVYGKRDPNEDDWKVFPSLYVNKDTDTLFIKGSKGWLKVPTEYSIIHNQPERSKREDSTDSVYIKGDPPIINLAGRSDVFIDTSKLICTRCGALNTVETR